MEPDAMFDRFLASNAVTT